MPVDCESTGQEDPKLALEGRGRPEEIECIWGKHFLSLQKLVSREKAHFLFWVVLERRNCLKCPTVDWNGFLHRWG
jgi:hypothetical protein